MRMRNGRPFSMDTLFSNYVLRADKINTGRAERGRERAGERVNVKK